MTSIGINIISTTRLTNEVIERFWALYKQGYDIPRETFFDRWPEFDYVAIFHLNRSKEIVGFIGIRYKDIELDGRKFKTIYYGQGYIQQAYRGKKLIQRLQTKLFIKSKLSNPFTAIYFWADALSFKPYLAMANYLCDYYPNPGKATPATVQSLNCKR